MAVVAEVGEDFALPAFGQFVTEPPQLLPVVLQRGLVLPVGVVALVKDRVGVEFFLDPAELLEGRRDAPVSLEDPKGKPVDESDTPQCECDSNTRSGSSPSVNGCSRSLMAFSLLCSSRPAVPAARVPDHPGVGVLKVVAAMPGERIELPPVAGQLLGGTLHVGPVD